MSTAGFIIRPTSQGVAPVLFGGPGGSASILGQATLYYAVVANFPGGSLTSNILTVQMAPNTLSSTNLIALQWTPIPGATSYDVLKLTSATLPTGSTSVALHTGLTTNTSTDTGSGLSSYTIAAPPAASTVSVDYNVLAYATPQLEINGIGASPGVAVNTIPGNASELTPYTTNATATGVTIPAAQIVNGLFTHSPTGAVNDTTDTATAILTHLQSVYAITAEGTAFEFSVFNSSASAVAITVVGGTGVTIVGTATVAQNAVRNFKGVVTAIGTPAVSLYSLSGGAF